MGIKNTFSNLFRKNEENSLENNYFDQVINAIVTEAYSDYNEQQYWVNVSFGKLESYKQLKVKDVTTKKEFVFYLLSQINKYIVLHRKEANRKNISVDRKSYLLPELFNLLMRSNLGFTDNEIEMLFKEYKKSDEKAWQWFKNWPIGFTLQQVERIVKERSLSVELNSLLKDILKWPQLKAGRHYWGSDLEKVKVKIEKIIFESENADGGVAPYILSKDRLAEVINPEIEKLKAEEQNHWYSLFHLFIKATGSKPSAKYLKSTSSFIDSIGSAKYKKQVHEWLDFIIPLKEIETPHTHDYGDGTTYQYTTYDFLHEKNTIFLKGLVWSLSKFHDSKTLSLIAKLTERSFKKIPGVGPTAAGVGNACIYVLGNTKGLEGISHLSRLKLRIKQNNTKKLIEKYIESSSEKLGISTSEIEELSIPDFGLTDGFKSYSFDDYTLELKIEALGKVILSWVKPDGTNQKSVPSFIKNSATHKKTHKRAKDEVAQIKKYLTAQRDRIDRSYLFDRIWTFENFSKFYINHGLVSFVAKDLVWEFKNDNSYIAALHFQNKWRDINDKELTWITDETEVRFWHPINSEVSEVLAWRGKLEELQIKQALKQVYREVYILTDAEINTKSYSNRMAAHLLKQHQFNALTAIRGWRYSLLGAYDDGRDGEIAKINLKEYGLEAQFWINEIYADDAYNDAGIWNYVATDQVRFVDENEEVKDLIKIPKIVLSEIMRDVDLFVGVASVGNDPEWRDNGGLPQYRDYWTSYSFGDLNEVAKTRKGILEKLVPRLKINKVANIDGKFLKIKGTKRVYKIHIGSTNILMEPNDQYLCIVTARGKDKNTEDVFLPFEGDRGLSLILSKAFLLAADDKIDDQTILSQINR